VTVAETDDLETRSRVQDVGVARHRPGFAVVGRFAHQRPFRRRSVVAEIGDESAVVLADDGGLDAAEADDRLAAFPGGSPVITPF
jgi:hypothetical protein